MTQVLRFSGCELRIACRELHYKGQLQALPPKAFDLLVHLVRHRDRAVTKAELLEAIWKSADVSENVIAHAVMAVRKAIGDGVDHPPMLRTVHRVGYRFLAKVEADLPQIVRNEPKDAPARHRLLRVALLPVDNSSGDELLDWITTGLPFLVGQALRADTRLSVLDGATVQHALSTKLDDVPALLGVQCLVRATVRRAGDDGLRLDYRTYGERQLSGSLPGSDASALGRGLAEAIEAGLFPESTSPVRFQSDDPLACQSFGRALDLSYRGQWAMAARMFRVVMDMVPNDRFARLLHMRMLANLRDPEVLAVGQDLLADAQEGDDKRFLAAAHEALGSAILLLDGDHALERSRQHMDTALSLAQPFADEDWVIRIFWGQAVAAHVQRDHAKARRFYRRAWLGNERAGNQWSRTALLTNQAAIEYSAGNLLVASEMAKQALRICERYGLQSNAIDAWANLALCAAGLGLFGQACERCEAAIAIMEGLPPQCCENAAWVLLIATELALECRRADLADRAFAAAHYLTLQGELRVQSPLAVAHAYRAAAAGDRAAVARYMRAAIDVSRANGYIDDVHLFFRRWLELCLRQNDLAALPDLLEEVVQLPAWQENTDLQAARCRALAAIQLAQGDVDGAGEQLREAVRLAPLGQVNGLARLDLAWLCLESGRVEKAQRLLRDIGAWLHYHPAGQGTAARLAHALGRADEAVDLHRAWVDGMAAGRPVELAALGAAYGSATPDERPVLPRLPRLVTTL